MWEYSTSGMNLQKMKVMKAAYCAILIDLCFGSLETTDVTTNIDYWQILSLKFGLPLEYVAKALAGTKFCH